MIKTGSDILFQEPNCETRRLRRSVVVDTDGERFSVQFAANPFVFEVDQEVLMYFNGKGEFMQQVGCVVEVEAQEFEGPEATVFTLDPVGDPISAESRQFYRVSTISADLRASLGEEHDLDVQDLSATGFAVIAAGAYSLGETLPVQIAHAGVQCHGTSAIQSIREFEPGRIRYGMRALEDDPHTGEFLHTLQGISLAVQREQLQRS